MKKKIVACCLLLNLLLVLTPLVSALGMSEEQPTILQKDIKEQSIALKGKQASSVGNGYLLFLVFSFIPGEGISPYKGANVTARGLFHSYNGTTDDKGVCIFKVQAPLLREKLFFVKVSILSHNRVISRIAFIHLKALQISYKGFLFLVL